MQIHSQTARKFIVASLLSSVAAAIPTSLYAQTAQSPGASSAEEGSSQVGEIVVTAQKRQQSVNSVPMSITAATGDTLASRGVLDTTQLPKIVPGLSVNYASGGQPIYTLRGVGFQESSLAAAPTVSVYVDEVPIPVSAATLGAAMDLDRVEVLKGPQGTLFGQNATGGAINYVAAKPTDTLKYGADLSYSRFNTTDASAFVSGGLTDTLKARVAVRWLRGDDWQKSGTRNDSMGSTNRLMGRASLQWDPASNLSILLNVNGWRDRSETQAPQFVSVLPQTTLADVFPALLTYPGYGLTPRSADWDPGKNYKKDNRFYQTSLRADYTLVDDIKLTSITSFQKYTEDQPAEGDGTPYEAIYFQLNGSAKSFFQELRLSGSFGGNGNWIFGGNYQRDVIPENSKIFFRESTSRAFGGSAANENTQKVRTKAVYGNVEVPLTPTVTVLGGVRYTESDRTFVGCTRDLNGSLAPIFGVGINECVTTTASGFGLINKQLNENNVSWRAGVNFKPSRDLLLYANVSKGYKSGSFPLISILLEQQAKPVTQESVLAYEGGVKATLADRHIQLNAAVFYYDYKDKQTLGLTFIPPFGNLQTLINIPKSHIFGFEASAVISPIDGLTIPPSVTMVKSQIDGNFTNVAQDGTFANFSGEPFPFTPKWSGTTDAEYRWDLNGSMRAVLGATASYRTKTKGSFGSNPVFNIDGYTTVDLRAGIESSDGTWKASVFGRNVFNKYYWTTASRFTDTVFRYAGMPATYGVSIGYRFQ